MVSVRVHRHAIEVLAKAPVKAATFRQEIEVAIQDDGTGQVDVHRHAVEVLAKFPDTAQVSRQEIEVAIQDDGTGGEVQVHRHGVEALAKAPAKVAVHRQEIEVAIQDLGSGEPVLVHRHAIEVLARRAVPPITPLPYPTGLDYFLHNWVANVEMETRYMTDITRSPTTLAEERRGLLQRPQRLLKTQWLHTSKAEVGRLLHNLRRLTDENLISPLYQDTVVVTSSGTGQIKIFGDFRYRRYYDGGRVAVFTQAPTSEALKLSADIDIYTIQAVFSDRIEVDRNLDQNYADDTWFVVPLIDLEVMLTPSVKQLTDTIAEVSLTLNEVVGKNALPPSSTGGVPDGWQQQLGLPVFETNPDWADGIETTYHRYGQRRVEGRKPVVVTNGERYVQKQDYKLKLDRPDYWAVMNLFDSRRGRLDTFWEVDQEFLWTVVDTDPTFIDVTPPSLGIFSQFQAEFTDHCGIVMNDGTVYIREVFSIADTGSWRLTLAAGNPLPDPIDVTQIKRFSRARVKRFDQDSISELWHTTELVDVEFTTIEVLNEMEVDI